MCGFSSGMKRDQPRDEGEVLYIIASEITREIVTAAEMCFDNTCVSVSMFLSEAAIQYKTTLNSSTQLGSYLYDLNPSF